jgi:hypothetical protein
MSVVRTKSKAAKAKPSPDLKAHLEASLAEPPLSPPRRATRVLVEDDPHQEEFWRSFRAIGTALARAARDVDQYEGRLIDWCSRQVIAKAEAARLALTDGGDRS